VAVCEDHRQPGAARNSLVWLELQAAIEEVQTEGAESDTEARCAGRPLFNDSDFMAWPRISPCGTRLA